MKLIFFIKSGTVNITKYSIKDIPGSSGRLDVISRCILAALLAKDGFEKKIQIWVFLDKYNTYLFDSEKLNYEIFPKNEIYLTDCFVNFLRMNTLDRKNSGNPLYAVEVSELSMIEAIKDFLKLNYEIFVLKEDGTEFKIQRSKIQEKKDIIFIVGSQEDDFINSKELLSLNLPTISIGNQSYLASSVIRLLKLHLLAIT